MELLIVDGSESFAQALTARLSGIFTVRCCGDGERALRELQEKTPDILLLHLALPRKDGLTVLRQLVRRPETILVMTNYTDRALEEELYGMKIRQLLVQPTVKAVTMWLTELSRGAECMLPQEWFSYQLQGLGFSPAMGGYEKLLRALLLLERSPTLKLKEHIYPYVGVAAEKSIRDAITCAYSRGDRQAWAQMFPGGKPSNKVFLRQLLQVYQDRKAQDHGPFCNSAV